MKESKSILQLAIPNILSNVSVPLLGTVDTALMGRLSESHIAAVGIGGMIFSFIYWNFSFLRMGTTGMTAKALGAGKTAEIRAMFWRAILVAFIIAIIILSFQSFIGEIGIQAMNTSGETTILTSKYFYTRLWAAPATLGLYAIMGWFFGMQNAIYPLILTIAINVCNMVISFYCIYNLQMDVDGVAWGTVIAQYFGLSLGLILWRVKYPSYAIIDWEAVLQVKALKSFFLVNRDLFIRTLCLTFAFGFFYSQSSAESTLILAVNVILLQYLNWMSYGIDGFAYAAESLVGKYNGEKNFKALQEVVYLSFLWGGALAVLYSIIYAFFGNELLTIFTDQTNVIEAAQPYIWWMIIFPLVGFSCYIWDGIFVGLTASNHMRNSMIIGLIVYLSSHFLLAQRFGINGMWMAFLLFLTVRGLLLWKSYREIKIDFKEFVK